MVDEIVCTYIYGLKCPVDKQIRYIGKSDNPKNRYQTHMCLSPGDVNRYKKHWIKKLISKNQKPELVILEKIEADSWEEAEVKWIKKGRQEGWKLTNLTDGGANNYKKTEDLFLNCIEVLADYLPKGYFEKIINIPFEELTRIAKKAAHASMNSFFGVGEKRDIEKSVNIRSYIINDEINNYLVGCDGCQNTTLT